MAAVEVDQNTRYEHESTLLRELGEYMQRVCDIPSTYVDRHRRKRADQYLKINGYRVTVHMFYDDAGKPKRHTWTMHLPSPGKGEGVTQNDDHIREWLKSGTEVKP